MSLNTAQLWQSIQENGIATAADCRSWASEIVESAGAAALNDPQLLLAQLIKLKKITPFQANAFLSNSLQTLTIGRHRLLAPLTSPALLDWFEAIDPASNAARWIYAIPSERLQSNELLRHPPSLLYSKQQASVKGDSLQSMSPPAMLDGYLLVAATPAPGKPLRDELKNYRHNVLPNEKAMKIIFSLSVALADLHDQGVVHGRIGIDQIWWDGGTQVTLLRDPFFPPVSPLSMDVPVAVGVATDQDFRIRYAAPEFTAPAQQPTPATDMYSLGCLWWELVSGRLPFWDTMLDKVPTSACMFPLAIPQDSGLSQGQQKCLEYLLAKTPSTRFQNGRDFLRAFKVVVPQEWLTNELTDDTLASATEKISKSPQNPKANKFIAAEQSSEKKQSIEKESVSQPSIVSKPSIEAKSSPKAIAPEPTKINRKQPLASTPVLDAVPKIDLTTKSIRPPAPQKQAVAPEPQKPPEEPPKTSDIPVSNTVDLKIVTTSEVASPENKTSGTVPIAVHESTPVAATIPEVADVNSKSQPVTTPSQTPRITPKPPNRKKKKKKPVWFLPSIVAGSFACLGLLGWLLTGASIGTNASNKNKDPLRVSDADSPLIDSADITADVSKSGTPPKPTVKAREVDPLTEQFVFATGENSFPWLPPRASKPYSLEMLAPGLQGLLIVRPEAWMLEEVLVSTTGALSKTITSLWDPVHQATGIEIANVKQIAIGLYSGLEDGWPDSIYRITLSNPTKISDLKSNWKMFSEQPAGNKNHLWESGTTAIFTHPGPIDEDREITQFTWGPVRLIRDLAEVDGNGSAITRSLEDLWQSSDSQSDLSLLLSTNFLFSSARNLLPSINPSVNDYLRALISEKTLGIAFTTSLNNSWYGELRLLGREAAESAKLLEVIRIFMKEVSNEVESAIVATPANDYWRALALRYPQMLRSLNKHLRFGLESGQLVGNFYLPKSAAPNLAIATWMMLQQSSFQTGSLTSTANSKTSTPKAPASFSLLEHPVTINFEQEPLDSALGLLSEEVNGSLPPNSPKVSLSIDGKAFELSSVTRNQQIRDFRFMNAPLRKLLTDLATRVNPDKTVTSIKDPRQAVVWIVAGDANAPEIVFTTRRGIEGTQKKLPEEFQGP